MDMFEEENSGRVDIPGLPDSERGGKKGKKKGGGGAKKTLSLQNFLQDENQEPSNAETTEAHQLEAHFAKLNLDQEELIVMESCHSYIHDILRQLGPTNAMDPILQQEINNFPDEAKNIIKKVGGYRNFILRSKDLVVMDKIVAAKSDFSSAQEMAFKEIFSNLPATTRPESIHQGSNRSNLNRPPPGSWPAQESPRTPRGGPAPLPAHLSPQQQTGGYTAQQRNLLAALGQPAGSQGASLEERLWKLQEENTTLLLRAQERDQLQQEVAHLRSSLASLEALQHNTKNDLVAARHEVEAARAELGRARGEPGAGELAAQLRQALEAEQARSRSLQQELESRQGEGGLFPSTPAIPRGPWQTGPSPAGLQPGDGDLLGLRSMVPGPWSSPGSPGPRPPGPTLQLAAGGSFLPGGSGRDMFGGLGHSALGLGGADFQPLLGGSGLGAALGATQGQGSGLGAAGPLGPVLGPQGNRQEPALDPPQRASPPALLPQSPPPPQQQQGGNTAQLPGGSQQGKAPNRQEMLVKKLVTMLPPGTTEDTITKSIQLLRTKNGKLSGWATSKIAAAISELMQSGEI